MLIFLFSGNNKNISFTRDASNVKHRLSCHLKQLLPKNSQQVNNSFNDIRNINQKREKSNIFFESLFRKKVVQSNDGLKIVPIARVFQPY